MNHYRVYIVVVGSPTRPPYDGHVDTWADTMEDAARKAKNQLLRGSFQDVWPEDIRIKSVELKG